MWQAIKGALSLVVLILVLQLFFPEVGSDLAQIVARGVHLALLILNLVISYFPTSAV